jgi:4-amino-4-deoxy-L-arabinose transferase-like glycosyltransferase
VTHPRRWIVACVVAGLALRAAFAVVYWTGRPMTHDEREYLALARSLARGEGYRYPADEPAPGTGQQFGRAPGYPAFLSTFIVPVPVEHIPRRVQIVQASVAAVGIWLIAAIAWRTGGPRAGVAAAAIAAAYPPAIWMPAFALSEALFSTLALTVAFALAGGGARNIPSGKALFISGVAAGIATLVRPSMIFFMPFAVVWIWRRRSLGHAAAFVLLAALVVAPWTIRNHRVYGRWVAVASEGGVTFWTGNHPLATGDGDLAANPDLKRAELAFRAAHPGLTPEQLEPLYYRDALGWIRGNPGAWLGLVARKAFYTVVPLGPSYAVHSSRYFVASAVSYALVLVVAIAGAWRARTLPGRCRVEPLWLMAASTVAAGLVFFTQERFRLPVIDPALIVTAALVWSERAQTYGCSGSHADL